MEENKNLETSAIFECPTQGCRGERAEVSAIGVDVRDKTLEAKGLRGVYYSTQSEHGGTWMWKKVGDSPNFDAYILRPADTWHIKYSECGLGDIFFSAQRDILGARGDLALHNGAPFFHSDDDSATEAWLFVLECEHAGTTLCDWCITEEGMPSPGTRLHIDVNSGRCWRESNEVYRRSECD